MSFFWKKNEGANSLSIGEIKRRHDGFAAFIRIQRFRVGGDVYLFQYWRAQYRTLRSLA